MVCNNFIMSVTICIKSKNYACQGSRGCWWLDTCKESWTNLTKDDIETWDVRYIYFLIFFALPALINSIQKAPTTLPPRQMKLKNSGDIDGINCYRIYRLSSFHWLSRGKCWDLVKTWKCFATRVHASMHLTSIFTWQCAFPVARLDIGYKLQTCTCATLSQCYFSPRQKAGLGEEETHDKDTNVTKNK